MKGAEETNNNMQQPEQAPVYTGYLSLGGKKEAATLFLTPNDFHVDVAVHNESNTAMGVAWTLANVTGCQQTYAGDDLFPGTNFRPSKMVFYSPSFTNPILLIGCHIAPGTVNLNAHIYTQVVTFSYAIECPDDKRLLQDGPLFTSMTGDYSPYSSWFGIRLAPFHWNSPSHCSIDIKHQALKSQGMHTKTSTQSNNHRTEQPLPRRLTILESATQGDFQNKPTLEIHFCTHARLESQKPLPYREFRYWFETLTRLLEIAYEQPLPDCEIHAQPFIPPTSGTSTAQEQNPDSFNQNPRFYDNWAVSGIKPSPLGEPLFTFNDIGREGITKWISLFQHFGVGIGAFCAVLESPTRTPYETRVLLISSALEYLGGQLLLDCNRFYNKADGEKRQYPPFIEEVMATINDLSKAGLIDTEQKDGWAQTFSTMYNGTKHIDHKKIPPEKGYAYLEEAIRLIRYWVAYRIGCPTSVIAKDINRSQSFMITGTNAIQKSLFTVPSHVTQRPDREEQ